MNELSDDLENMQEVIDNLRLEIQYQREMRRKQWEQLRQLEVYTRELMSELQSEVEDRWIVPHTGEVHPANEWRYERDLDTIKQTRAFLEAIKDE